MLTSLFYMESFPAILRKLRNKHETFKRFLYQVKRSFNHLNIVNTFRKINVITCEKKPLVKI